ncbi:MAG TPA: MBL fold metallo-hydrolase [Candidatus Fusicatenibacter intestinigallinarum]|uniref:MBL fold metallo-hydrolase n=1 Tax=Candidatus Fusicatenibacter intestinigallinarum TaxID=2838598 RepID=A0A9D2NB95_9FIRM|nr:MBL fold metallo-hydrolase [Candidatus Fusicatenibacter intestinigallinarum]
MSYVWYKKGAELLKEIEEFRKVRDHLGLWYIGQMGMVFGWNGKILCVDPVLGAMPDDSGMDRRNYPAPFEPEEFSVDFVFCTHDHGDHMHGETLRRLAKRNPEMKIFLPEPLKKQAGEIGIPAAQVVGMRQKEILCPGNALPEGFSVRGVATAHEEYRFDETGCSETLGYVFRFGPYRLFHSGDTVVTREMAEELKMEQGIDVLMVPINGRDLERHARGIVGNMDSREACWFGAEIGADLVIPLHYDMIGGNEENPLVFADYMERLYPDRKYHIMRLGEGLKF